MRTRNVSRLTGFGLAITTTAGLFTVAAPAAFATPDGCWSRITSSVRGRGACTDMSDPGSWRLGIRCNGQNYYTPRKYTSTPASKDCPSGTTISHVWIDTFPT
ncbi:hypothetical protein DZF91_19160 [Actinomadura logoneensis]|uniref:Secreted protein n=1 Tax=Actinomadura logoneensis TaxID=2293572 RepID=A0A372JJ32_9ACTN|nr:hypothetical protein [Actinomadura logoneensis]RFU40033.1 hypothetical protein DZF91_19160 [Actinomadura logoneensis]